VVVASGLDSHHEDSSDKARHSAGFRGSFDWKIGLIVSGDCAQFSAIKQSRKLSYYLKCVSKTFIFIDSDDSYL
jgi:hypothetical protein